MLILFNFVWIGLARPGATFRMRVVVGGPLPPASDRPGGSGAPPAGRLQMDVFRTA